MPAGTPWLPVGRPIGAAFTRITVSSPYPIDAKPPAELFDRADATLAITTAEAVIAVLEQLDRPVK